jgi:hypothetical protein
MMYLVAGKARSCAVLFAVAWVFMAFTAEAQEASRVRIELYVMSKCPYGAKMMAAITPNVKAMRDRVNLDVYYVGRVKGAKLDSMHGQEEVQGDILQLCARELGDLDKWLDFISCQNEDLTSIPVGWDACAQRVGLDVAAMKTCSEGTQGKKLAKDSFNLSEKKKVVASPTVFLDGQPYKGGRGASIFGKMLCAKMGAGAPPYCATIPEPQPMTVTIVGDKKCTTKSCDTSRFLNFVKNTFSAADVRLVDYSEPEGKQRFEASGQQYLPLAFFPLEVEKEKEGFDRLKRRMAKLPDGSSYVYPLGRAGDSEPPRPAEPPAAVPASASVQSTQPIPATVPAGTGAAPAQPASSCGCSAVGHDGPTTLFGLLAGALFSSNRY